MITDDETIIDITGDQFRAYPTFLNYDRSVYVGVMDEFHRLFKYEDRDVHESNGISAYPPEAEQRLNKLYRKIIEHLN